MLNMHEWAVCEALLGEVARIAALRGPVVKVTVQIGVLAGVNPGQLASAFGVMRRATCAADAALVVESIGVVVRCLSCAAESRASANRLLCADCGSFRTQVIAGEEMNLIRIELVTRIH
jgi:hydrogenase nickel incorporation protein HypA/HybF